MRIIKILSFAIGSVLFAFLAGTGVDLILARIVSDYNHDATGYFILGFLLAPTLIYPIFSKGLIKENTTSLSIIFIILGIIDLQNVYKLSMQNLFSLLNIGICIRILFGIAYLYFGMRFKKIIAKSFLPIIYLILADMILSSIFILLILTTSYLDFKNIFINITLMAFGIVIDLYLIRAVKKVYYKNKQKNLGA